MPRKGENIYRRKDERWEGRYVKCRDVQGKPKLGYVYGRSYKEVKEKLQEAKQNAGDKKVFPQRARFRDAGRQWMQREFLLVKESTYAKYCSILKNHLYPYFGGTLLRDIDSAMVNGFVLRKLNQGEGGLAPKTVRDIYTVLKSVLRYAEQEYGVACACQNSAAPRCLKNESRVLNREEWKTLEQYLFSHQGDFRNLGILLSLYTGMRLGELCALKWGDISVKKGTLQVSHTLQRIQSFPPREGRRTRVVYDKPKTRQSIREIPIPRFLLDILHVHLREEAPDAFFLTGSRFKYVEPRNYQYYFQILQKRLRLAPVKFHGLRHSFATRCMEAGFDMKSLSEILGHANVNITMSCYIHSSMERKQQQMNWLTPYGRPAGEAFEGRAIGDR